MTNWLRKLMPQQENFFPLFNEHAEKVEQAAGFLRTSLGAGQSGGESGIDGFVEQGRAAATKIQDKIRSSFVTPFDRSDIKEMTASMQTLLEDMRSVARVRSSASRVPLDGFTQLIVECAGELRSGVARLQDFDKHADELRRMRDNIGGARERMQALHDDALLALLAGGADDPLAALASSRMLERVSRIVERFDDVADHIDDLVLDHV